jgi:TonB-dependent SusC/RagA subfamily outer membrane receptor
MRITLPATFVRGKVLLLLAALSAVSGCFITSTPRFDPQPAHSITTVTGAVSSLDADDARKTSANSLSELLDGRFSGVEVTRLTGDRISIRIRGQQAFGSAEPLYVVNGVPLPTGGDGRLSGINAADVKRIEVLKDVSATSIYGARGANGVVLITLRRP